MEFTEGKAKEVTTKEKLRKSIHYLIKTRFLNFSKKFLFSFFLISRFLFFLFFFPTHHFRISLSVSHSNAALLNIFSTCGKKTFCCFYCKVAVVSFVRFSF
jgi:hypothetical protein